MRQRTAILGLSLVLATGAAGEQTPPVWQTYRDAQGRFTFDYPTSFGTPGRGTDDGFQGRAAAVRFSALAGLGGEAVVTSGPITVDVQALGGLYDAFARTVFPDAELAIVMKAVPAVTRTNFCALLGAADHLQGQKLPARLDAAARQVDATRNLQPAVHRCNLTGDVVLFHKEATFVAGRANARQHLYGALRFLPAPYSSFQIVRGGTSAPSAADLDALARMAASFTALQ
jgi:hypothetical protein